MTYEYVLPNNKGHIRRVIGIFRRRRKKQVMKSITFVLISNRPGVFISVRAIKFVMGFCMNTHRNILFDKTIVDIHCLLFFIQQRGAIKNTNTNCMPALANKNIWTCIHSSEY